jgi:single-stranded-DNA-specific exonuclease
MTVWNKKDVSKEVIKELHTRYGCDLLTASILARRGITKSTEVLFYLEDDLRYQHNPFLFSTMEDAVDRILDAKDEGEKVLIFGDRDVDGITSTTVLYQCLSDMGIDVQYRLPSGNDQYGLSIAAIDDFAKEYGTLIITVDCGISNNIEIAHAAECGISVIVVDHHNPPEILPSPAIIVNPKMEDSGYPFKDISGCAVVYKLVSALRFAQSDVYKQEICLLNVSPVNEAFLIECIKVQNMCEKERLTETIMSGVVSIHQTRLIPFLQGQQIFVWNQTVQKKMLAQAFGEGVEFNMFDIRTEIGKIIPSVQDLSLLRLKSFSKTAKYQDRIVSEIDVFFNIFITFIQKSYVKQLCALTGDCPLSPIERDAHDLQLVAIAALADIMPLQNENRILVRQGLASLNTGKVRPGLLELMARQNLLGKRISSTDLSWTVSPALNATGRLGQPETALKLFLSPDQAERNTLADQILQLNVDRRKLGVDAWDYAESQTFKAKERFSGKLIAIYDERIHRGVTGILSSRIAQAHKVPAIIMTKGEEGIIMGSMRSALGYDVTSLLDQCASFFINHGGHDFAAGFSLYRENLENFLKKLEQLSALIELPSEAAALDIDAELQPKYLTPDILKTIDLFEPFGEANPPLLFMTRKLSIVSADIIGKTDPQHLKLTFACGGTKWPAMFWKESARLKRDFDAGDTVDVVFQISRNTFNGIENLQMIISDIQKSRST